MPVCSKKPILLYFHVFFYYKFYYDCITSLQIFEKECAEKH